MSAKAKDPDLISLDREIGLRGTFYDFVKMAWHVVEHERPFVDNWHIGAVAEHLEAVFRGQIKRLSINIPPGCMKSLTTSVLWQPWCWIQDPGWRTILGSFDASLVAKRDGGKVLDIVRGTDAKDRWFRDRWGDRVSIKGKDPSAGEFYTTKGGMRFATSVGGRVVGRHGNAIVIDDPIKPQGITDLSLSESVRWKQETISSRLLPGGAVVLIMQRLHERDLAGHAEEEGGWDFLRLPMRFEEGERCTTSIGFADPRHADGELLWPTYKTETDVAEQEKDMGGKDSATVAAQLQQRPAPAKGLIFQKDWFQYHGRDMPTPVRFDFVVDSWDCTFKDTESSDFVVGQRWGMVGPNLYLLARWRGRWSFSRTLLEIASSRSAPGLPKPHATLVEDKANGTAVLDVLRKKISGFVAVNPLGGKVARANAVTPLYESKNVWHPHVSIAPWIEDHEGELLKFPKGKNDDSVDSETQALAYLSEKASKFRAAMDRLEEEGIDAWLPT